tara:strand:- start:9126 stop:10622 length:1497 start_codon:yes stop_codon:yes gene_type:complete
MKKQKRLWIWLFMALFLNYASYSFGDSANEGFTEDREYSSEQESKKLEAMKKRWDELIKKPSGENPFFDFQTEKSQKIREESKTEEGLHSILKEPSEIETLISLAFERSPELKAAKKEWESKIEAYSQVLQLEDILGQFSSFIKDIDTKSGPMLHKASIKKRFLYPGAITLKGNIVEREVKMAKEKYNIALRDTIADVKKTFYEWVFILEEIRITKENLTLLKELESVATIHFRTGKGGFNDVIKAQIKISKMNNGLKTLQEQEKVVIANISRLLDLPLNIDFGKPSETKKAFITLSVEALYKTALKNEQNLKLIQAKVEKSNLAIELAEEKYYTGLSLGFSYFENRKGNKVGVAKTEEAFNEKPNIKTDLWFGKDDAYIREARLKYQSLLKKHESHKNMIKYNISKYYFHLDKAKREILLYEDSLLALAQKELEVAIAEYQTGKADFLSLLHAQTTLLKFQLDRQRALKDYGQSLAMLEQVTGVSLVPSKKDRRDRS